MKKIIFIAFLLFFAPLLMNFTTSTTKYEVVPFVKERLDSQVSMIKEYIEDHQNYNDRFAFFVDLKIESGRNRFFVYDLKNSEIIDVGLVSHGLGSDTGIPGELKFSDKNSSLCTSLGKYSIGSSYQGQYGKAYKLFGLDETNKSAFSRSIVLHKFDKMPYEEQEKPICLSMGCPMLNEQFYARIEKYIDGNSKHILLNIYY